MNFHGTKKIHPEYPDYTVYSNGDIFSHLTNKILKPATVNGYQRVFLKCRIGTRKNVFIHRLVAELFVENPNGYNVINHKDENRINNDYKNLEWCTQQYNSNYGTCRKRSCETRRIIEYSWKTPVLQYDKSGNLIKRWKSQTEAERYGFNQGNIGECARGKRKTHKGYIWRYE